MKILMTNNALDQRGGSESYFETVAQDLRQLGHELVLFSPACGQLAETLRGQGFDVYDDVNQLPQDIDVIHGQHVTAVGRVRSRFPRTPMVFVTHSWVINPLEDPVAELAASAFVAFNRFTESRLRAHTAAAGAEIVRLTQPVAISFADRARTPIRSRPTRAIAVSRHLKTVPARLAAACAEREIEFEWVGGPDSESPDARREMMTADIVFAVGRTALEAMAAARAVVVMDESARGGWVTTASYQQLEADGFTGALTDSHDEDFGALLGDYDATLGTVARRLVTRYHGSRQHATSLVELYSRVADLPVGPVGNPQTISRLASERTLIEARAVEAEWAAAGLRRELADARRELADARLELADARLELDRRGAELASSRDYLAGVEAELETVRAQRDRARARRRKSARQRDEALQLAAGARSSGGASLLDRLRRRRSR